MGRWSLGHGFLHFVGLNKALVISGAFDGCLGIILTLVMCRAMNRSIVNVLIGGFGDTGEKISSAAGGGQAKGDAPTSVTSVTAEDVVDILTSAKSVIIALGYGMAACGQGSTCHSGYDKDNEI